MTIKFKRHYESNDLAFWTIIIDGKESKELELFKDKIFGGYAVFNGVDFTMYGIRYRKVCTANTQKEIKAKLVELLNK